MSSYSFQGHSRVWVPRDEEENRAIFSAQKQETGIKMPNEFDPVYLANAEYDVERWSVQRLSRLIRLYGAHRCLWDVHDYDYRNKKMRNAAIVDITSAMGEGLTSDQILKKIKVIRATYQGEKRRIKQRIRQGLGATTKLKWFSLADTFLRNVKRSKTSQKNDDNDSDLEDTAVFNMDPESILPIDDEELYEPENESDENSDCERTPIPVKMEANEYDDNSSENAEPNKPETPINIPNVFEDNSSQEFKTIEPVIPDPSLIKKNWTSADSMRFVRILESHPILWNMQLQPTNEDINASIERIADEMNISTKRIRSRVEIFKSTYKIEKSKINEDPLYKPNLIWWPLAESFMKSADTQLQLDNEADNFVDLKNTLSPQAFAAEDMKVENLEDNDDVEEEEEEVTNCIPSAKPTLLEKTHLNDSFLDLSSEEFNNEMNSTEMEENESSATKLIWNGLDDDLLQGKWPLKYSVKFLRLYGAHRCLWDINDPDYRSREMRNAAIQDIAAAMGYGLNADFVTKKLRIFRITYMQQRKRMREAINRGEQAEIQLRWFPLADCFLRPNLGLNYIEAEEGMPQFDYQYVVANLNLIDSTLLTDFRGSKGTQNTIAIGENSTQDMEDDD